ncbi:hypothetical protein ACVWZZ_002226 [Bradyrhizobium sp. LM6.10]|jgi:hypothetical protein
MLMTKERRPAVQTLRGWAINVLQDAGAIHECEEHGWAKDKADPHTRGRAIDLARQRPPSGLSPGTSGCRDPGRPGLDQRYLPGMPAA